MKIFNILQKLFNRNNGITNILDSKLRTGLYANYKLMIKSFLLLNENALQRALRIL